MAYIGLRKPIIGKMKENGTYEKPFKCGQAIGITVTPNYAESSLDADDVQIEYDKVFNYADTSLNTSTLPREAHTIMFGHKSGDSETEIVCDADDEPSFVGFGFVAVEKINGKKKYTGNFLCKVKFSEPSGEYATRGDNIEYKTPSISGRALANDKGKWKFFDWFDTEAEALEYVYKKFGFKPDGTEITEET